MLAYSSLALFSFKPRFPLVTINLGSLEFSSSLDVVDQGIFFPSSSTSSYLASSVLRASSYSGSNPSS